MVALFDRYEAASERRGRIVPSVSAAVFEHEPRRFVDPKFGGPDDVLFAVAVDVHVCGVFFAFKAGDRLCLARLNAVARPHVISLRIIESCDGIVAHHVEFASLAEALAHHVDGVVVARRLVEQPKIGLVVELPLCLCRRDRVVRELVAREDVAVRRPGGSERGDFDADIGHHALLLVFVLVLIEVVVRPLVFDKIGRAFVSVGERRLVFGSRVGDPYVKRPPRARRSHIRGGDVIDIALEHLFVYDRAAPPYIALVAVVRLMARILGKRKAFAFAERDNAVERRLRRGIELEFHRQICAVFFLFDADDAAARRLFHARKPEARPHFVRRHFVHDLLVRLHHNGRGDHFRALADDEGHRALARVRGVDRALDVILAGIGHARVLARLLVCVILFVCDVRRPERLHVLRRGEQLLELGERLFLRERTAVARLRYARHVYPFQDHVLDLVLDVLLAEIRLFAVKLRQSVRRFGRFAPSPVVRIGVVAACKNRAAKREHQCDRDEYHPKLFHSKPPCRIHYNTAFAS